MSEWTQIRDKITGQLQTRAVTALENAIQSITVETAYGPPIVIDNPLQPSPPSSLLQALKPKVTIQLKNQSPTVITPYGDPGPTKWPMVKLGAYIVGGFLVAGVVYGIYRAIR